MNNTVAFASDDEDEQRGCTLFSFTMHPSLYSWSDGRYLSVDGIPFQSLHSVYFHGPGNHELVSHKIQQWMHGHDMLVVTVNRAVLDPLLSCLLVFDILMKKDDDDSYGAMIGLVSHTNSSRGSMRRARAHAEHLRSVCHVHYNFFPRIVIFRISRNESLRAVVV